MALSPFGARAGRTDQALQPSLAGRFGVLQPQEVILGLCGEYMEARERAWSGGFVQVLGDLGFSTAASRVALNRVIARGLLKPEKEGRFVFYRMTPRMRFVQEEGRRQIFSATVDLDWPGSWTIVIYTINEQERAQRARLGRWLSFRGFGSLQDGVWIAPGDDQAEVESLARRLGIDRQIVTFVGNLGSDADIGEIARRAWRIGELKEVYDLILKRFSRWSAKAADELEPRLAFVERTNLIEMFRLATMHDPRIPDKYLKSNWKRNQAVSLFQDLQQRLHTNAAAYFRGMVITGKLP